MLKKTFQKTLEHLMSLLVVFLLLASTAVWTGKLLGRDIGSDASTDIRQSAGVIQPTEAELSQLQLNSAEVILTPRDSASWNVVRQMDRKNLGVILCSTPYAPEVQGFAGPTPLYIYIAPNGEIVQVASGENAETPSFLKRAFTGTVPQWYGKDAHDGAGLEVDAVSGATYTSKALIANMQSSLAAYSATSHADSKEPAIGWLRTIAVVLVLLIGFIVARKRGRKKRLRIAVLVLNVGVLGFWCGQFLSLSILRGWLSSGIDPILYLPTLLMLLVAIVLPFFGHKHHYCSWVCPYGSLQELAGRLPLPKIHCSAKVYKVMAKIRFAVLVILLLLLWTGLGGFLLDYEPFTAFMVTTALPAVIVLAAVFVVASCFVPNLWCKCFCPMGSLLDLSEKE